MHLNICWQPSLRASLQIALVSLKLLSLIAYIESKCRFVAGSLYRRYYSRLTCRQAQLRGRTRTILIAGLLSILLVAILLRLVRTILINSLFNEGLRLFRLDWPTSFSGSVLLRPTDILYIAQIVPLVVSFSLAIASSEQFF